LCRVLQREQDAGVMPSGGLAERGESSAADQAVARGWRSSKRMLGLEDLEIGLMFWAGEDPVETLRSVKKFGLRAGQLGLGGTLPLQNAAERWDQALTQENFTATTAVC